jgi:hypothetical protein
MWLFTKYGFFSVTQNAKRKDNIQIHARAEQDLVDLKAAYPALDRSPIIETPDADYRWRLIVQRWKWDVVGAALVADIDYGNFKGKIATIPTQREKSGMLHDIWDIHHQYQQKKHRPDPLAGHPSLFRGDRADFFESEHNRRVPELHRYDDDQPAELIEPPDKPTPGRRKASKAPKAAKGGLAQ